MTRLCLALTAVALFAVSSMPAKADWSVIRWNSGWCQLWDHATLAPMPPINDYKVVGKKHKTLDAALAAHVKAVQTRACGW